MVNKVYRDLVKDLVDEYGSYLFQISLIDIPKLELINEKHKAKTRHLTLIIQRLKFRENATISLQNLELEDNKLILKHPNTKGLLNE